MLVQALASVKVVMIAAGESHSAAITDKGALYTWGRGNYGRLGHGWHSNIITTYTKAEIQIHTY